MEAFLQDTKIISALITATVALIIALTGAVAFFYRSRRDSKRDAKKVLFHLLGFVTQLG